MEPEYYHVGPDVDRSHWTLYDFLYDVKQKLLDIIPSLPLYFPKNLNYLSEVKLPDGKSIFISDAPSASNELLLTSNDIRAIVTIRTSYAYFSPIYKKIDYLPNEVYEKLYINMDDTPGSNLFDFMESVFQFFDYHFSLNHNTLIHCTAGRSRSVSFLIAYIMIKYKLSFEDAYHLVEDARPEIRINDGFARQLKLLHRITGS